MDLYDYKPEMDEWYDKDLPDSVRMGQRLTTMTSGQARFPDRAVEVQVRPARQVRHVGQRTAAVHGEDGRRHVLHPHRCTPRRSTTSRPSRYMQTGNQITGRPCLGSWVVVRPGLAQREPADVRRAGRQADQHRAGAGDLGAAVVSRAICPANTPASPSAAAAIRSCTSTIRPACRRDVRRNTLDGLKALNEMNYQQVGDPETHTRIEQYELAFRMQASVPELTDIAQRAGVDLQALRRRRPRSPAPSPTPRCWPGGWSSAACASCRSTTTTGTRTPTSPAGCPTSAATSISRATA